MLNHLAIIIRLAPCCPTTLPPPVPKNAAPPAAPPAKTADRARECEPRGSQTVEGGASETAEGSGDEAHEAVAA